MLKEENLNNKKIILCKESVLHRRRKFEKVSHGKRSREVRAVRRIRWIWIGIEGYTNRLLSKERRKKKD